MIVLPDSPLVKSMDPLIINFHEPTAFQKRG